MPEAGGVQQQHHFAAMEVDRESAVHRYRGMCACGHENPWGTDEDAAWEAMADHLWPYLLTELMEHIKR